MLLAGCLMTACATAFGQSANLRPFTIEGTVVGTAPAEITLNYQVNDNWEHQTVKVTQGKFRFNGSIPEPCIAAVDAVEGMLWIEPASMTMTVDMNKKQIELKGSRTEDDNKGYELYVDSIAHSMQPVIDSIQALYAESEKTTDSIAKKNIKGRINELEGQVKSRVGDTRSIQISYLKAHPNSYYSAFLLYPINSGELLPVDSCIALYNHLSPEVQESSIGRKIKHDFTIISKNRIGEPAPLFTVRDRLHNTNVSLKDLRGKVVVMDFWAPWCAPCRFGFKRLKELYKEYHNKGLEVIAVYTDRRDEKEKWLKAIKDDGIADWHHVLIAEDMTLGKEKPTDLRSLYYVMAIPRRLIIDRQGRLVKIWVGVNNSIEDEVAQTIKDELAKP